MQGKRPCLQTIHQCALTTGDMLDLDAGVPGAQVKHRLDELFVAGSSNQNKRNRQRRKDHCGKSFSRLKKENSPC